VLAAHHPSAEAYETALAVFRSIHRAVAMIEGRAE
jgi:hypothetical protein